MLNKGLSFVLSAPAGTGKTTLTDMLALEFPRIVKSVSFTTRNPRAGEREGLDYCFITKEEFEQKIADDEFLEYVRLYDHYYGTSKHWVEERLQEGKHVFLVIDTQGALQLKGKYPAIFIFVKPPSFDELQRRLKLRGTESDEMIEKRLEWAKKEVESADKYDYLIVNDQLKNAYDALKSIVIAEEHRVVKY